jgi:peptidoglycan hydrolase CwlO-like protein
MTTVAKEELDQINSLKSKLASTVSDSGQLALQIQMMESEITDLKSKLEEQGKLFKHLVDEEQALVKRLSEKYGAGSINFETGEFIPEK